MGFKIIVCSQDTSLNEHVIKSLDSYDIVIFSDPTSLFEASTFEDTIVLCHLQSLKEDPEGFLEYLLKDYPSIKVMLLTHNPLLIEGTRYLKSGLKAYGQSFMHAKVLNQAIEIIQSGNVWIYPELSEFIISQAFVEIKDQPSLMRFNARDQEIIQLVKKGLSNK
ncbi:MAG: hypothetical protein OEW60_01820, partial [Thiovulaceae bacterium]|nr:hypothetical protein [Sulfurimonadaceae bacterium]